MSAAQPESQTFTLCPRCGHKVDPSGEGVHFAVEMMRLDTFGGTSYTEGLGGFFHAGCSVLPGRRSKPLP